MASFHGLKDANLNLEIENRQLERVSETRQLREWKLVMPFWSLTHIAKIKTFFANFHLHVSKRPDRVACIIEARLLQLGRFTLAMQGP